MLASDLSWVRRILPFALLLGLLTGACGPSNDAARAAVGAGVAVAATGVNRAITKECWARCSPGYVCNRRTGLCEPGECSPTCPAGYSCTILPTATTCVADGAPLFNPVDSTVRLDQLGPRGTRDESTRLQPLPRALSYAERNQSGQVQIPPGNPGALSKNSAEPDTAESDSALHSGSALHDDSEELRLRGDSIFDELDTLVKAWRPQLALPLSVPPPENEKKNSSQPDEVTAQKQAFEAYVDTLHRRVHRVYSDGFLARIEQLSATHALSNRELKVLVLLLIDGSSGEIVDLKVSGSSGSELFDVAVLESFSRAAPFGPPPEGLPMVDGKVFIYWEVLRHVDYACSSKGARPSRNASSAGNVSSSEKRN